MHILYAILGRMKLSALDYGIIGLYFLVMIGIGVYSVTFARGRDDYLLAGRRLRFPLFFGCMAAMAVSVVRSPSVGPRRGTPTGSRASGSAAAWAWASSCSAS